MMDSVNWEMYGAKLVDVRQNPRIAHTAACHIFRPAYLHSRNTATPSTSAADIVTVNQSPPFRDEPCRLGSWFPVGRSLVFVKRAACLPA
jgi:hypothetical protein